MRPTVNHWADLQHNAVPSAGANVNNNTTPDFPAAATAVNNNPPPLLYQQELILYHKSNFSLAMTPAISLR